MTRQGKDNERDPKGKAEASGSLSLWASEVTSKTRPPLVGDTDTDVCVIGAGISGLTAAYLLSRTHRVIVLERYAVGSGDSGRTTAHLTSMLDRDYEELAQSFGEEGVRSIAESHGAAIDFIERTVEEEGIDCQFERVDGFLVGAEGEEDELERIAHAARLAGLSDVKSVDVASFADFPAARAVRFPRQAQFHPLRYLQGLAAAVERRGGVIHGGTAVLRVGDGKPVRVETGRGSIVTCSAVVMATHAPLGGTPGIHARQSARRSYVIAGAIPMGSVPRALLWDTQDPYHYLRVARRSDAEDMLVVGGEDHPTGVGEDSAASYRRLERWARDRFPALGEVTFRWSGQLFEPHDGLGYAGAEGGNGRHFLSTGHSGNGMTHGTLSAILLAALVQTGEHAWERLYDPGRKALAAAPSAAKSKHAGEVDSETAIGPGHGAVVSHNGVKVAVFRDEIGNLWECSAVCSHMGCTVCWNGVERSWDCPCHGSRFDVRGRVLNAPASEDLAPAAVEKKR